MSQLPNFIPIIPEIIVLTMACVILMVDLFLSQSLRWISYALAQATLIIAACVTLHQFSFSTVIISFHQQFILDHLSIILKLFMYITTFGVFLYSREYNRDHKILIGEYHVLGLLSLLGGMVMVSAGSMLLLYLGLELLSLPIYAMVSMRRNKSAGSEASIKYFIMGAVASAILLYGMSLIYGVTGSLQIDQIMQVIGVHHNNPVLLFGMVFFIVALGFKFGAVPFHMWAPDVYQGAPTSVTAFIATMPKLAAFGLFARLIIDTLPSLAGHWHIILIVLAVLSLFIANLSALMQTNIKRLLAYSTIAHVGFLFLGFSLTTSQGDSATLFYMIVYVLMSLGAFGVILMLNQYGHKVEHIHDLTGLNTRNPWLAFMFLLILFSMAGVPPLAGFDAKLAIIQGLVSQGHYYIAIFALLMSVIAAFYYIRLVKIMYFDHPHNTEKLRFSVDSQFAISINGLALLIIGIVPAGLFALCQSAFSG